ncbi:MAG: dihydrolipoyl dehydrogenase [Coraliomargaritaceae bacterium]
MGDSTKFDITIIGSGPAGYVAAIKSAHLGFKTALIEKSDYLGGTCLNVGCIPSKALLHSSEIYHTFNHNASQHGIEASNLSVDIKTMMQKKNKTVQQLRLGIEHLMKKNKIKVFQGTASFRSANELSIDKGSNDKEAEIVNSDKIIIATGSSPKEIPSLPIDGKNIVTSDQAIAFTQIPEKLAVVGAGAIGLELGSVWSRLGAKVDVIEFLPQILAGYDKDIADQSQKIFKKQGLNFYLNTKVTECIKEKTQVSLSLESNGKTQNLEADKVLVAIGRVPNTDNLNLKAIGLETDAQGRIAVNQNYQTEIDSVYAIGDVIKGPMLAHKAEEEGIACVELIANQAGHVNYQVIPNVVYTEPEIASVGITEAQAKEQNLAIKIGKFNLSANGRAIASDATDGSVKIIADAKSDRLLGIQLIAKGGSEMISACIAHMEYGGSSEDIARTINAHPTLSESIKEAAMNVYDRAIHS